MLFKPDLNETAKTAGDRVARVRFARAPPDSFDCDHAHDSGRPRLHRLDVVSAEAGREPRPPRFAGAGAGGNARAFRTCRSISTPSAPCAPLTP